jgi:hypothetical protein
MQSRILSSFNEPVQSQGRSLKQFQGKCLESKAHFHGLCAVDSQAIIPSPVHILQQLNKKNPCNQHSTSQFRLLLFNVIKPKSAQVCTRKIHSFHSAVPFVLLLIWLSKTFLLMQRLLPKPGSETLYSSYIR